MNAFWGEKSARDDPNDYGYEFNLWFISKLRRKLIQTFIPRTNYFTFTLRWSKKRKMYSQHQNSDKKTGRFHWNDGQMILIERNSQVTLNLKCLGVVRTQWTWGGFFSWRPTTCAHGWNNLSNTANHISSLLLRRYTYLLHSNRFFRWKKC